MVEEPSHLADAQERATDHGFPLEVEVALVGERDSAPPGGIDLDEWARRWSDRSRVTLEVGADETLASVIDRAHEALGSTPFMATSSASRQFPWIAFDQESERPLYQRRISSLVVLDENGRAVFVDDFAYVQYEQLTRTADAGLLPGDPRRLLVIRQVPQGDIGLLPDWPTIVEVYLLLRVALDVIATVSEARERAEALQRIVSKGVEGLRRVVPALGRRNLKPSHVQGILEAREWSPDELSRVLGCSVADLENALPLLGLERGGADGLWRMRPAGFDQVLDRVEAEIQRPEYRQGELDRRRMLEERITAILAGAQLPDQPPEQYEVPPEQLMPDLYAEVHAHDRNRRRLRFTAAGHVGVAALFIASASAGFADSFDVPHAQPALLALVSAALLLGSAFVLAFETQNYETTWFIGRFIGTIDGVAAVTTLAWLLLGDPDAGWLGGIFLISAALTLSACAIVEFNVWRTR